MRKLALVLLLSSCVLAQPTLDSVYVFEELLGFFSQAHAMPDGGYILNGMMFENGSQQFTVLRIDANREVLWQRGLNSIWFRLDQLMFVDSDQIFCLAKELIPIDSNSYTSRRLAILYTTEGDSLWSNEYGDSVNFTTLDSATPDGYGGFVILGAEGFLEGNSYNYDARLIRIDSTGTVLWERYFGGNNSEEPVAIVKLAGDSVLFTMLVTIENQDHIAFVWANLDGDSLTGRIYSPMGSSSIYGQPMFARRGDGWELAWSDPANAQGSEEKLLWLVTDHEENALLEFELMAPVNSMQSIRQTPDGLMTVGFSIWGATDRDATIGRVNMSGMWYYNHEIEMPLWQEAYGFLPNDDGPLTLIGRTQVDESYSRACFFYLSENVHESYLYALPSQTRFGIVPLDSVAIRDLALVVSAESSVTVTALEFPEYIASALQPPVTIAAGESLHFELAFQPAELRTYSDTIHITSDALNPTLSIPVTGEAPFPVCVPLASVVNFFWISLGDSARRPLAVRNTGTIPLHIEPLHVNAPFRADSLGPFSVEPDSFAVYWFTFRPDSIGDYRDTVLIMSDEPQGPDTLILAGRCIMGQVSADEDVLVPHEFKLHPAYPNPFNATAQIEFDLPKSGRVTLELFDVTGRRMTTLVDEMRAAGNYRVSVDASGWASGIYFAALRAGGDYAVQKLLLVK